MEGAEMPEISIDLPAYKTGLTEAQMQIGYQMLHAEAKKKKVKVLGRCCYPIQKDGELFYRFSGEIIKGRR
jgi:hypothetical protein